MFYSLQVGGAVFVVPESILALVAAGNDMIECSLKFNPRLACHSANLYRKPTTSQYSGLTLNTYTLNTYRLWHLVIFWVNQRWRTSRGLAIQIKLAL